MIDKFSPWKRVVLCCAGAAILLVLGACPLMGPGADTDPPSAVSLLDAIPNDRSVLLTWQDPTDSDLDHIEVSWTPGGPDSTVVSTGSEQFTATGLTNGTEYTFSVWAVDSADNESTVVKIKATPVGVRVVYDANSADTGSPPSDTTVYKPGEIVTVLGNPGSLEKADHTFAGWDTQADQGGLAYNAGDTFQAPEQDVTLYAIWNPTVSVQISFAEPSNPTISFGGVANEVTRGNPLTVTASSGYTGYSWYLDGSSTHAAVAGTDETATIDTTNLPLGVHSAAVVLDEGYSAQFSFTVVE
jgi:uncharacterized repeat protein (TIGR02543 family)